MKEFNGVLMHTYIADAGTEDYPDTYEVTEDVTDEVNRLIQDLRDKRDALQKQVAALQKELVDIKSRRYWDEVELVTNKTTGMTAAIRTTYRWQAETMRLDFTNEMYSAMGVRY